MYLLAQEMAPCTCVELGVAYGRGVRSFAKACPHNKVFGVESNDYPGVAKLEKELPNLIYLHQSSTPMPDIIFAETQIDILHCDTEHSFTQASEEYRHYRYRLVPGSIVLFDDLHAMDDGVMRAFMEIPEGIKIVDDRLHPVCGYGVLLLGDI